MPDSIEFNCHFGTIAAIRWNVNLSNKRKIIALHGWLDNAASFDLLAPLIDAEVVAIDSAGHGKSSFRHFTTPYTIYEDVFEVIEVADALNWQTFELLGHSRGAGIATLTAGSYPDRVTALHLLDGGIPKLDDNTTKRLRSIFSQKKQVSQPSTFKDKEQAILARSNGFTKLSFNAAEILASRGLQLSNNHYYWSNDPNLKKPTLYFSEQQLTQIIASITCYSHLFIANDGLKKQFPVFDYMHSLFNNMTTYELPGSHHFHLEGTQTEIADIINSALEHTK